MRRIAVVVLTAVLLLVPIAPARAAAPAVSASVRVGAGSITVSWHLRGAAEAVRVVRSGLAADGSTEATSDRPAENGSLVIRGLLPGRAYSVRVAPVVGDVPGRAVVLHATPSGATRSAPTGVVSIGRKDAAHPSGYGPAPTPKGWSRAFVQDFGRSAALGAFADRYPGWAGYDGNLDTSRDTGRPRSEVGIWNSATTTTVHGGLFDCRLHTRGVRPQVCALTPMRNGGAGRLYGRYAVRFRVDAVPGYKIAWLLWPASNRWTEGELDFPEAALDGSVTGAAHRVDGDPADVAFFIDSRQRVAGAWHTATIAWAPGRVTFILDGRSWTTSDRRGLPAHPMRWALQAETAIRAAPPNPAAQGHILIDWVEGWRFTG